MQRFTGRITTYRPDDHYGFVGLSTVLDQNDSGVVPETNQDIYVHQDDSGSPLRQDLQVVFSVVPDSRRGGNALRAVNVLHQAARELVLVDDSRSGGALVDPRSLYVPPTKSQQMLMKPVAPELVGQVLVNRPMPLVPRSEETSGTPTEIANRLMERLFPQFSAISEDSDLQMSDERFDAVITRAVEDHKSLGMHAQAQHMLRMANVYKGLRTVVCSEQDLLRPQVLIPIQYLPDLFMAVPVWYFWADSRIQGEAAALHESADPKVHPWLQHFCRLENNQRWINTFLMFNRRMRTLGDYRGDIIPPKIISRMRKLAPHFDFLTIMTPYHDVAGKDWDNIQWLRSIDPYVVGFLKGIPLMFVLGRFSDSGTFPLYHELVGDTIGFLRANIEKLKGFNAVGNPYWFYPAGMDSTSQLGTKLQSHTRQLLAAFDAGNLFDWLRGEESTLPAKG